jgi:hypothetical protein
MPGAAAHGAQAVPVLPAAGFAANCPAFCGA